MKSFVRLFMFVGVLGMLATPLFAEEAAAPKVDDKAAAEKAAMMEKMKVMTSPGPQHKVLEQLAGKFNYTSKFWMSPDAKPEESKGTAENTMVFGSRFLKQEVKGDMMGQPFEGIGYSGYDNIKGEYVSVWLDSMVTGIMTSSGQFDAASKTLGQSGVNSCPLTGEKDRKTRSAWTITDNDHSSYVGYFSTPDGKEYKAMEITYTRA